MNPREKVSNKNTEYDRYAMYKLKFKPSVSKTVNNKKSQDLLKLVRKKSFKDIQQQLKETVRIYAPEPEKEFVQLFKRKSKKSIGKPKPKTQPNLKLSRKTNSENLKAAEKSEQNIQNAKNQNVGITKVVIQNASKTLTTLINRALIEDKKSEQVIYSGPGPNKVIKISKLDPLPPRRKKPATTQGKSDTNVVKKKSNHVKKSAMRVTQSEKLAAEINEDIPRLELDEISENYYQPKEKQDQHRELLEEVTMNAERHKKHPEGSVKVTIYTSSKDESGRDELDKYVERELINKRPFNICMEEDLLQEFLINVGRGVDRKDPQFMTLLSSTIQNCPTYLTHLVKTYVNQQGIMEDRQYKEFRNVLICKNQNDMLEILEEICYEAVRDSMGWL